MNGKRILITGASGFIGGFLVEEALNRGYEVWAGVRASSNRAGLRDGRIHFIELRYDDQAALTEQLQVFAETHARWDYVIHNAGLTKALHKEDFSRVNAGNTHRLIEALAASGCSPERFLLMSSLSSYGMGDEKDFRPIRLDDPQRPNTAYGRSKLEAENYLRRQDHFPYVILRPTGVYGPGERDYFLEIESVNKGFDFAVGSVPQRITFIYVRDLARVALLALESPAARNREYFVADGDVHTDEAFARLIQESLGKKRVLHVRVPLWVVYPVCLCCEWAGRLTRRTVTLNTDKYLILKQRNWVCDISPLREELGFTPRYDLRKGLEESIAWYRSKGWL